MMSASGKRLCWCYEYAFIGNPIALQAVASLAQAGWTGVLADQADAELPANHLPNGFAHRRIGARIPKLYTLERLFKFFLVCLTARADVLIASQPLVGLSAWCASRIRGVPLVYYTYELFAEQVDSDVGWKTRLFARVESFLIKRAEGVVCTTEEIRNIYVGERGSPSERTWVVHNMLSPATVPRQAILRDNLKLPASCRKVLLYTGALQKGRCIPETIEAFSLLDTPDACLVFVGRNTETDFWEQHAQPVVDRLGLARRVHCAGWFPPEHMSLVVSEGDVGIILYASEPRNNYQCTASRIGYYISQGVPVIVPPYPYIARMVRESGIGIVADDCSPHGIARAMESALLMSKKDLTAVFEKARQTHNWEKEANVLMRVLDSVRNL